MSGETYACDRCGGTLPAEDAVFAVESVPVQTLAPSENAKKHVALHPRCFSTAAPGRYQRDQPQ